MLEVLFFSSPPSNGFARWTCARKKRELKTWNSERVYFMILWKDQEVEEIICEKKFVWHMPVEYLKKSRTFNKALWLLTNNFFTWFFGYFHPFLITSSFSWFLWSWIVFLSYSFFKVFFDQYNFYETKTKFPYFSHFIFLFKLISYELRKLNTHFTPNDDDRTENMNSKTHFACLAHISLPCRFEIL